MNSISSISQLLTPHIIDLAEFQARRSLFHEDRATVGSFMFFNCVDPAVFPLKGINVRPHPQSFLKY